MRTSRLEVGYHDHGPGGGPTVVLVHGWPDDPSCWDRIVPSLTGAGLRCVVPYLRGVGPTRFLSGDTPRSGQIGALGSDLAELLDALDLRDAVVAGHDWGARAGYVVAALFPRRMRALVAMSSGYATTSAPLPYSLAHAYWYEWFVATARGRRAMRDDRRELVRYLWSSWSPGWRYSQEEFDRSAETLEHPDWAEISIHAYLHRWNEAAGDPAYQDIEDRLAGNPPIAVPTLVLHGEDDADNAVSTTAGKEHLFTGWYERTVLPGVGHFVPREAPDAVVSAIHRALDPGRTAPR